MFNIGLYKLNFSGFNGYKSFCYLAAKKEDDQLHILLIHPDSNKEASSAGTSVTNAIEIIASELYKKYLNNFKPSDIHWYDYCRSNTYQGMPEKCDRVLLEYQYEKFKNPDWTPSRPSESIMKLLPTYLDTIEDELFI